MQNTNKNIITKAQTLIFVSSSNVSTHQTTASLHY